MNACCVCGRPCCGTIPDTPLAAYPLDCHSPFQVTDAVIFCLPARSVSLAVSPAAPAHYHYTTLTKYPSSSSLNVQLAIMSTQADWSKFSNQPAVTQPTVLSAPLPRLRFHVGKRVICQYGQAGWVGGTIMAHHYSEEGSNASWPKGQVAPYQVVRLSTLRTTLSPRHMLNPALEAGVLTCPISTDRLADRRSWTSPRRACPRVRTRAWPSTASR